MARRTYKKVTLRIDPELHEDVAQILSEAANRRHRDVPMNYLVQELLRAVSDVYHRQGTDRTRDTFKAFIRDHL